MKALAFQLVITLLVVGVALAAYDYLRYPDIAQNQVQLAALKQKNANLVLTAQSQAQELGRLGLMLSGQPAPPPAEPAIEQVGGLNQREGAMSVRYVAPGLQEASAAKIAIAEHYQQTGEPPVSNLDAGLAEPVEYKGDSLRRMTVSANGTISLVYDERSGVDNGKIQFIPVINSALGRLDWRCVSPDFTNIAITMPPCEYVGVDVETAVGN